jgi:hypothetical protein
METPTGVERIRIRAYELYLARGSVPGCDQEDWLQAEREVMAGQVSAEAKSKSARTKSGPVSSSSEDFDIDGTEVKGRTRETSRRGRTA